MIYPIASVNSNSEGFDITLCFSYSIYLFDKDKAFNLLFTMTENKKLIWARNNWYLINNPAYYFGKFVKVLPIALKIELIIKKNVNTKIYFVSRP